MTDFWSSWWAFAFMMTPFALCFSGVALSMYIAFGRDFDVMLARFEGSNWLKQQIPIWGTRHIPSRFYLVNTLCAAMLHPPFGIKRGLIDADEVRKFPRYLKCRMVPRHG
ncbi:hypothetical protein D3C80_1600960 [compost metagenome]